MIEDDYREKVEEAGRFLEKRLSCDPEVVVVLGTGLGDLVPEIAEPAVISYGEVPGFPCSTVQSHAGKLVSGTVAGRGVVFLQGRLHFYEGYSTKETTLPLRTLSQMGASTLLITNAAGGLNPDFAPGSMMLITDHLNFIPENPLRGINHNDWGPRFPDMSQAYDPELISLVKKRSEFIGKGRLVSGVYCAIPGPSLETPAETRFLRNSGADAVGMSTVPEVIVARHAGMRVLGISVIANVNDPDDFKPIILEDVISISEKTCGELERLVMDVLHEI